VAASKNTERDAREARDRLRRFNARQSVYSLQVTRRRRDNLVAVAGVIVIATLATLTQIFYFAAGPGMPAASASPSPSNSVVSNSVVAGKNVGAVPAKTIAGGRTWTGELTLNAVKLGISLDGAKAPQATSVFVDLAKKNFYTSTGSTCHRLTTSATAKLIQCGSVDGKGSGDIGFSFGPLENVPADGIYPAGTIAMARGANPYSQSSQFFITYAETKLDPSTGGYTVFGTITSGLADFVSKIADGGVTPSTTSAGDGAPVIPTKITQLTVQ
jgi:peptidyl-prolyl cis-trans isomerase B (cyclophilin B)